jgi:tetratricopeptide (TPR) repeat protein
MTARSDAGEIEKRATSLMKEGRHLEAIELLKKRSSAAGKHWKLSWNLGWCYFKLGRFDDARKHLIRAFKLAPDDAVCKWALGAVCLKKRQFKKAEAFLVESLRIKESHVTRISLAFAYLALGKTKEAEKIHIENIKLGPRSSGRYKAYAAFLSDVGREAESESMMRKAKALRSVN